MQIMEESEETCNETKTNALNIPSPSPAYSDSQTQNPLSPDNLPSTMENTPTQKEEEKIKVENVVNDQIMIVENNGDNDKIEVKEEKLDEKDETEKQNEIRNDEKCNEIADTDPVNNENNKRKLQPSEENAEELQEADESNIPGKKIKFEEENNYECRDRLIQNFIEISECNNVEQIQSCSEQILNEIKCLNEMAKEKEKEWNQLLHMKKFKEELLIRLQRKRQMIIINDGEFKEFQPETVNGQLSLLKCNQKATLLKQLNNLEKSKNVSHNHIHSSETLTNNSLEFRHKQRPTLDVQRIIADYRLNHPETVPRRGRRIRQSQTTNNGGKTNILGFSGGNFTIGQRIVVENNGDIVLSPFNHNNVDGMNRDLSSTVYHESQDASSYKEIVDKLSALSQKERNELQVHLQNFKPPPSYPEVTVHPVTSTSSVAPTNSLLHGILTKTTTNQSNPSTTNNNNSTVSMINHPHHGSKTSFSPTLARLLTAPERSTNQINSSTVSSAPSSSENLIHSNLSISDIFCGNKARNEITITPVENQYDNQIKTEIIGEEVEDQSDRLIIDESTSTELLSTAGSGDGASSRHQQSVNRDNDNCLSENSDEVPLCQGCNLKPAQFVCAGCGDQWYCSRNCQIAAWDEHSEVCSG